jgi:hypothetical protein
VSSFSPAKAETGSGLRTAERVTKTSNFPSVTATLGELSHCGRGCGPRIYSGGDGCGTYWAGSLPSNLSRAASTTGSTRVGA